MRPSPSARTAPTTTVGSTCHTTSKPRPASDPTCQNRNASSDTWLVSSTAVISEPSAADTAAPAKASFTGVAPSRPRDATTYTITDAAAAPANANQTYPVTEVIPNALMATTTASDAPKLTPRMPGSASGIARQPLHDRAGQAESQTGDDPEQGAGHTAVDDDERVVVVLVVVQERLQHRAGIDRPGTEHEAQKADDHQREHGDPEAHEQPPATPEDSGNAVPRSPGPRRPRHSARGHRWTT